MKHSQLISGVVLSLLGSAAFAQTGELPSPIRTVERTLDKVSDPLFGKGGRNGHDKCKGNGHDKGEGKGNGHEEGECDEDGETTPPGPVEGQVIGVIAPVCEDAPVDSSWQRLACTLAQGEAAYLDDTVEYAQTTEGYAADLQAAVIEVAGGTLTGVLGSVGDGATGLISSPRPGPAPLPVIPGDIQAIGSALDSNLAQVQAYAADYSTESITVIGNIAATAIDGVLGSLGDGATGLISSPRPGPAPLPVIPQELAVLQQTIDNLVVYPESLRSYAADYTPVVFDASRDFTQTAIAGVITAGSDSATGLISSPRPGPAPLPVIPDDLAGIQAEVSRYVEYTSTTSTYVSSTAVRSSDVLVAGAQTVITSVGDGATGLLSSPRPGPAPLPVR